jgi:hypothetical protein
MDAHPEAFVVETTVPIEREMHEVERRLENGGHGNLRFSFRAWSNGDGSVVAVLASSSEGLRPNLQAILRAKLTTLGRDHEITRRTLMFSS